MDNCIDALDEFFCAQYSDYVRISAIEGYAMPDVVYVGSDGNVHRRDSSCMRLAHQPEKEKILAELKSTLADTDFAFNFSFVPVFHRFRARFGQNSFARLLPKVLSHVGETVESAGEKLDIEKKFWQMIAKGRVYPSKNLVLALALTSRLQTEDVNLLLSTLEFRLEDDNVRDVVVQFLLSQKIFNDEMRNACLKEYKIENLPIKRARE